MHVSAWTTIIPTRATNARSLNNEALFLSSISPPADNSGQNEVMGRILEGGKVIDFSSLKASSKAESALAEARKTLINKSAASHHGAAEATTYSNGALSTNGILGINDDVVSEVGHDLGVFCSAEDVQACAAYLRSKVPMDAGLFEIASQEGVSWSPEEKQRFEKILEQGYQEAGEVTGAFAKTFYMGTMLLPEHARKAIWAVYVWCRRTDEIVDAPRDNDDDMLLDLSSWELRLENLWRIGQVVDVYDLCLLNVRIQYPTLDIQPFMDMIRGMLMDVPGLGVDRYATFDELHLYCYRVAGTVGVMSLPVFGCAPGYNDEIARYVVV
jgi:15-cis-phytoene synthase